MSPKPRRRRKSAATRLRPFWFLIAVLAVLAGFGVYWLATWPALRPHTVRVQGNHVVSSDAIIKAAHIDLQRNVWLQNGSAMSARVAAIPYIASATVRRIPPSTIHIDVTERTPFAVVETASEPVVVDRELRVLQKAPAHADLPAIVAPSLPGAVPGTFLTDPAVMQLRTDLEDLRAGGVDAVRVSDDRFGDAQAVLRDGVVVLFGDETDFKKKIALVEPILEQVGRKHRPIATIDLRALRTPVVVYKR